MDASEALRSEAERLAIRAQNRARQAEAQLKEIEAQKRAANADFGRAKSAAKRLLNYQPRIGAEYQCPACWVDDGKQSPLSGVRGTATHNIMRCDACNTDWPIELR